MFLDLLGCGLCRWPKRSADEPLSSLDRHLCRRGLWRGRADRHSHNRPGSYGGHASNARQNASGIQPIKSVRMALLGCCLPAARVASVCLTEASPPYAQSNRPMVVASTQLAHVAERHRRAGGCFTAQIRPPGVPEIAPLQPSLMSVKCACRQVSILPPPRLTPAQLCLMSSAHSFAIALACSIAAWHF